MRLLVAVVLVVALSAPALAQEVSRLETITLERIAQAPGVAGRDAPSAAPAAPYRGGRGLITLDGITGMFLNPTSGTLPRNQVTVQYCAGIFDRPPGTEVQHTAMVAYGVTDWLEIGGFFRVTDLANSSDALVGGGPLVRVRLLRDESWYPEIGVGFLAREGDARLRKRTAFVAASKGLPVDPDGPIRSVRGHVGFRHVWQDPDVAVDRFAVGFVGAEIELPWHIFLVGEVATRDPRVTAFTPFAAGVQWRHPRGFGLSAAAVRTGGNAGVDVYAGIGINFR